MQPLYQEVAFSFIIASLLLVLMVTFIISFAFIFQRRQARFREEKQVLLDAHQREILQTQLETQNQTLEYEGQELHDHIGQMLTVVLMHLNVMDEDHPTALLTETLDLTNRVIDDIRALSKSLDGGTVSRFGLHECLQLELERIERLGRCHTQFQTVGTPWLLGEQVEIVLLRIAQEVLNNALKHAHCKTLTLQTSYQPSSFTMTITDDGAGFSVDAVAERTASQSGAGMTNLSRRAALLNGTCTVWSQPGSGTRIEINVPV